jgi:hypothetical protein
MDLDEYGSDEDAALVEDVDKGQRLTHAQQPPPMPSFSLMSYLQQQPTSPTLRTPATLKSRIEVLIHTCTAKHTNEFLRLDAYAAYSLIPISYSLFAFCRRN